nr:Aldo keto reductase domain containing protein [Haemonchus contortus]
MTVVGPTITLSNCRKMPQVGLGTWQSSPAEVKTATKAAIEAGYRLIDTAAVYQNEEAIGEAIKELIEAGKITRQELFITTKVWVTHMHPDDTEGAIRQSLRLLQLDYVDLYLAHMPVCFNHEMSAQNHDVSVPDIWRGLEGVYKKGLAKAIGVSNWNGEQIERVMKTASVPIHNCQVELHLYWPQHELQEVCKKHNISLTSYASLGSPGRVNFTIPGIKNDWAPAPNAFEDEYVKELAKKYSKTPAQILLRYLVDRNIAIIPKSVNPSRIVENFQVAMIVGGPMITLSNGVKMPQVGLGTWQSSPAEVKAAVKAAIEAGYRLIDTATCYQNEDAIGEAIKELIQAGKVTREELFITTKLWATHMHPDDTEGAIRESLRLLQLDYVDLYLAHMPACFNHDMSAQNHEVTVQDVWRGLEGVYKKGLAKAIGVSNWNGEQIERVMKTATVPIHNCQVELYLYWPQHELQEVCKKHNISLTSYASLGSPGRVNFSLPGGVKLDWAPAPNALEDEHVKELAKKYSKTPAQILLRYVMDRDIAIIPKSVNPSRIVENFQLFDFKLTNDDIKLLESTKHRQRLFLQDFMEGHPEDPFADERKH